MNVILEPFSNKFVNNEYLAWMKDAETAKFIQKAKQNISLNDLNLFVNKMIDSNFDYFFAILSNSINFKCLVQLLLKIIFGDAK